MARLLSGPSYGFGVLLCRFADGPGDRGDGIVESGGHRQPVPAAGSVAFGGAVGDYGDPDGSGPQPGWYVEQVDVLTGVARVRRGGEQAQAGFADEAVPAQCFDAAAAYLDVAFRGDAFH